MTDKLGWGEVGGVEWTYKGWVGESGQLEVGEGGFTKVEEEEEDEEEPESVEV